MFSMWTQERPDWRRHHHRRGPWGGGPFLFEFFGGQRGGGPRARRGDVRAAVLALLRERPDSRVGFLTRRSSGRAIQNT